MLIRARWFMLWWPVLFISEALACDSPLACDSSGKAIYMQNTLPSRRVIHLPITSAHQVTSLERRGEEVGSAGLGDYLDVSYNILVQIGGVLTPLLLDTGSSDLWVISDSCITECGTGAPVYRQTTFNSTGLDASLLYGDSATGTYAHGLIGSDDVDLAGLRASEQNFAAINKTNAGVVNTGSSGIFGLGFPVNSVLWYEVFVKRYLQSDEPTAEYRRRSLAPSDVQRSQKHIQPSFPSFNFPQPHFPDLTFSGRIPAHTNKHSSRGIESISDLVFKSYSEIAPFLGRLIATNQINPLFTVTLQRDTIDIGGNTGQLSIGELPLGVQNDSLTWVPVRRYTRAQGGLTGPPDAPDEVYPLSWEIYLDDVYLDGERLPRSNLSSSGILLSALIDTGNSLIRGPEDVISEIERRIGTSFPCSEAHTLAFSIGGKLFPIDPRDLIYQREPNSVAQCTANIVATDPPIMGSYLFSWNLGTPFLKGVLSAYYFGDLKYPSRDPPRIGFVSNVPEDAGERLKAAVDAANARDGNFPLSSEPAPTGIKTSNTLNGDAPKATQTQIIQGQSSGASGTSSALESWYLMVLGYILVM